MNVLTMYAQVPMSFKNLYERRGRSGGNAVAIAFAMTGIAIANLASVFYLAAALSGRRFIGEHAVEKGPIYLGFVGLLVMEFAFVTFVLRKASDDPKFAHQVSGASPRIAIWYGLISVGIFIVSMTAAFI